MSRQKKVKVTDGGVIEDFFEAEDIQSDNFEDVLASLCVKEEIENPIVITGNIQAISNKIVSDFSVPQNVVVKKEDDNYSESNLITHPSVIEKQSVDFAFKRNDVTSVNETCVLKQKIGSVKVKQEDSSIFESAFKENVTQVCEPSTSLPNLEGDKPVVHKIKRNRTKRVVTPALENVETSVPSNIHNVQQLSKASVIKNKKGATQISKIESSTVLSNSKEIVPAVAKKRSSSIVTRALANVKSSVLQPPCNNVPEVKPIKDNQKGGIESLVSEPSSILPISKVKCTQNLETTQEKTSCAVIPTLASVASSIPFQCSPELSTVQAPPNKDSVSETIPNENHLSTEENNDTTAIKSAPSIQECTIPALIKTTVKIEVHHEKEILEKPSSPKPVNSSKSLLETLCPVQTNNVISNLIESNADVEKSKSHKTDVTKVQETPKSNFDVTVKSQEISDTNSSVVTKSQNTLNCDRNVTTETQNLDLSEISRRIKKEPVDDTFTNLANKFDVLSSLKTAPKYEDSLKFLGSEWSDIVDLSVCSDNFSVFKEKGNCSKQVLISSVEELECMLAINGNEHSRELIHSKVVCNHFKKLRTECPLTVDFSQFNLPLPRAMQPPICSNEIDIVSSSSSVFNNESMLAQANLSPLGNLPSKDILRNIVNMANLILPSAPVQLKNDAAAVQRKNDAAAVASANLQKMLPEIFGSEMFLKNQNMRNQDVYPSKQHTNKSETIGCSPALTDQKNFDFNSSSTLSSSAPVTYELNHEHAKSIDENQSNSLLPEDEDSPLDMDIASDTHSVSGDSCDSVATVAFDTASLKHRMDRSSTEPESSSECNESPTKKKSRYELIMERKEMSKNNSEKKKICDNKIQIKDPKLASVCQKLKPVQKKAIPVINPLPVIDDGVKKKKNSESVPQKSDFSKQSISKTKTSSIKKTLKHDGQETNEKHIRKNINKDPRKELNLQKGPVKIDKSVPLENSSSSRSGLRFNSRGIFLTDTPPLAPKPLKRKITYSAYKSRGGATPNDGDIHAKIHTPNTVVRHLECTMDTTKPYDVTKSSQSELIKQVYIKDPRLKPSLLSTPFTGSWPQSNPMNQPSAHMNTIPSIPPYNSVVSSEIAEWNLPIQQRPSHWYQLNEGVSYSSQLSNVPTNYLSPTTYKESAIAPVCSPDPYAVQSAMFNSNIQTSMSHSSKLAALPNQSTNLKRKRPFRKDVSLLPPDLSDAIGKKVIGSSDILPIILSWNIVWLFEQSQKKEPPPICACIQDVKDRYSSFVDFFNTNLSLLVLETWHRIYYNWGQVIKKQQAGISFQIINWKPNGYMIEMYCKRKKSKDCDELVEGQLVLLKFSDDEDIIKVFGYVSSHKLSKIENLRYDGQVEIQLRINLVYRLPQNCITFPVYILPLYNLKCFFSQVDTLLCIKNSALCESLLSPSQKNYSIVHLGRVRYLCPKMLSDTVAQVISGVNLDEANPRIVLVEWPHGMDQLSILVAITEHVKALKLNNGNSRILLCTRSIIRLRELGCRLITTDGSEDTKIVILAKPDILKHNELVKNSLDRLVHNCLKQDKECDKMTMERECIAKHNILKNCDVLLALVTKCFSRSVYETLGPDSGSPITLCIVDEAKMCTEPESLVPLQYGVTKLVFFHDESNESSVKKSLTKENGFSRSFSSRVLTTIGMSSGGS